MNIPPCPNNLDGTCAKSDTYVDGERSGCYVIKCRTCKGINVWPANTSEAAGRYEAGLKQHAMAAEKEQLEARQREYSFRGGQQ